MKTKNETNGPGVCICWAFIESTIRVTLGSDKIIKYKYNYTIQIYSGITTGRVLDGKLLHTKILDLIHLNLSTDFHEDFSPIYGAQMN